MFIAWTTFNPLFIEARDWFLDKIIKQGVEYETPKRVGYVIEKVGTNSDSEAYFMVGNKKTTDIINTIAPLHKTSSNLLGLLDISELPIVIPPATKFTFNGASGSKARIVGKSIFLEPGEGMPGDYLTRYAEQHRKYFTYYQGTFSLDTDEAWGAGVEYEILSLTPLTIEKVILDSYVLVSISGNTVNEGDFGVKFYIDNSPLEFDVAENLMEGIDSKSMPSPPADSTEEVAFSLKDFPIELTGDHTLSVKVKNTSGADKSPASGSAWSVVVTLVAKYERAE